MVCERCSRREEAGHLSTGHWTASVTVYLSKAAYLILSASTSLRETGVETKCEKQEVIGMENENGNKNIPEKKFSTGAISATVWKNQRVSKDGKPFETCTVSLQRRYADNAGKWQSTNSLRVGDLPKAALVLEEAYKFLVLNGKGDTEVAESH